MIRKSNMRQPIGIVISGVLAALSSYLTPVAAGLVASVICPMLANGCSFDEQGPLLFVVGMGILFIATGTLGLRYIAKFTWSGSLSTAIVTCAFYLLMAAIIGGLAQPPSTFSVPIFTFPVMATLAFIAHAYLFKWLTRWRWFFGLSAAVFLIVVYVALPYALAKPFAERHESLVNQEDLQQAEALPFTIYAPSDIPAAYSVRSVDASSSFADQPAAYSMTYSTHPISQHGRAKSFYVDEQLITQKNSPEKCDHEKRTSLDTIELGPCLKIGITSQCDVYYQYPALSAQRRAYCKIGQTVITITATEDILDKDGLVRVTASLKPAAARTLQEESLKNR